MRFLDACDRRPVDATPVWLMRQAGRYLPEYRAIREKLSFVEMCRRPDVAAEVTLQPLRRFELDAAIIFADILLPLEPMGIGFHFTPQDGPVIERPVRSARDLEGVRTIDAAHDLAYVMDAIRLVRRELDGRTPLIGFSGAPFTLASYIVEGGHSRTYSLVKTLMYEDPVTFARLMGLISRRRGGLPAGADRRRRPGGAALRLLGGLAVALRLRAPGAASRALRGGPGEGPRRARDLLRQRRRGHAGPRGQGGQRGHRRGLAHRSGQRLGAARRRRQRRRSAGQPGSHRAARPAQRHRGAHRGRAAPRRRAPGPHLQPGPRPRAADPARQRQVPGGRRAPPVGAAPG